MPNFFYNWRGVIGGATPKSSHAWVAFVGHAILAFLWFMVVLIVSIIASAIFNGPSRLD